jgi:limonene-1,2-epoxide hydrolase
VIAAARLFLLMGSFGITAGTIYYLTWQDPEPAGFALLTFFFFACLFIGALLWMASPANRRRLPAPDTGLPGSASQERGAADEHGVIHHMPPTIAPAVYALAVAVILAAVVYRDKVRLLGVWGVGLGLLLFLAATAIWYRAVTVDTRAKLQGGPHGGPHGMEHGVAVAPAGAPAVPSGPPGPANYFEQVRAAFEVGDPDWAADAYAPDAVYYEPANPPHEGRDAIRAYLNDLLKGHPGLRFEVKRMGTDEHTAIVEWTWSFRRDGRRVTDQPGASVIQVGEHGITYHRDYL